MICVIDSGDQEHSTFVYEEILKHGEQAVYLNTARYPEFVRIGFRSHQKEKNALQLAPENPKILTSNFKSVYCLYTHEFVHRTHFAPLDNPIEQEAAWTEAQSALGSFFRNLDCFWVDPPHAFEQHFYKGYQLNLLQTAGFSIPETLMTNDPELLRDFYAEHHGQVIYKPCWFGAYSEKLTETDFSEERLAALTKAPVCFQKYIPGVDILVYLVYDEPFAAEMHSPTLDFRAAGVTNIHFKPIDLPEPVAHECVRLARLLHLNFAAIDLRRTPDGEYVFFEGNPSPVFRLFEKSTGYPIGQRLVRLLLSPPSQ